MKKYLSLLLVLGFVLYLKPGTYFPNGQNSVKVKYSNGGVVASVGQAGNVMLVVTEDGKRIYIPVENVFFIMEE